MGVQVPGFASVIASECSHGVAKQALTKKQLSARVNCRAAHLFDIARPIFDASVITINPRNMGLDYIASHHF
jgi:hypothetical protein